MQYINFSEMSKSKQCDNGKACIIHHDRAQNNIMSQDQGVNSQVSVNLARTSQQGIKFDVARACTFYIGVQAGAIT